ncbi:MAG: thymidylate synthase [Candidatus Firestonebacteria bacterium]
MDGNIPAIRVEGETLPEAWEKAVIAAWEQGVPIKTEYDKPGDPASRDCTMMMVINDPFKEPRIHRAFPGGLEDLEVYRQEVVEGIHDHWIKPEEGKWTYTYHERFFDYKMEGKSLNQINYIINKLSESFYSRRAQAITWNPLKDPPSYDPPCLQMFWARVQETEGGKNYLNVNTIWRSNDAYKAAFMNIFALTELQRMIAGKISEKSGKKVIPGRYVHYANSFHIYGSYFKDFKNFLETVKNRKWEDRVWNTEFAEPFFEIGKEKIREEQKNASIK